MKHEQAQTRSFTTAIGQRAACGFTLVEILIVVVILGILAMIVIPQFSNASHQARENTLRDDLRYLRTQIGVYRAQHRDVSPGSNGTFLDQMVLATDEAGATNATSSTTFKFGPYLSRMPANPLSQASIAEQIKLSNAADLTTEVDETTGWIYNPATQQIIANLTGSDSNGSGTPYAQY